MDKKEIERILDQANGESPVVRQNTYLKVIAQLLFIIAFKKDSAK